MEKTQQHKIISEIREVQCILSDYDFLMREFRNVEKRKNFIQYQRGYIEALLFVLEMEE